MRRTRALLRARRQRPCRRPADKSEENAASHCERLPIKRGYHNQRCQGALGNHLAVFSIFLKGKSPRGWPALGLLTLLNGVEAHRATFRRGCVLSGTRRCSPRTPGSADFWRLS